MSDTGSEIGASESTDFVSSSGSSGSLADGLRGAEAAQQVPTVSEDKSCADPVRDALGRAYATGRRKNAAARVWVKPGPGNIQINGRTEEEYFGRPVLRMLINQPMLTAGVKGQFDVVCTARGGGFSGQAGAIRHGIATALSRYDPTLRRALKAAGMLTRDSRMVERKKYGLKKARRSFQFSKR